MIRSDYLNDFKFEVIPSQFTLELVELLTN